MKPQIAVLQINKLIRYSNFFEWLALFLDSLLAKPSEALIQQQDSI